MKNSAIGFACLAIISLFSPQMGMAQTLKIRIDPQVKLPSRNVLSAEAQKTLVATAETVLNEYTTAATMMDAKKKKVSGESVKKYQDLFSPTAEVVKDYLENVPEEGVPFKDYSSAVFNLLGQEGVQVRITSATLVEIINDASGYFVPVVRIEKEIFNSLDSKGKVKKSTSGRRLVQEILFDVSKDELTKARIAKIRRVCKGKECKAKADFVKYAGFVGGVSYGFAKPKYASTWEAHKTAGSSLKIKSDIGLSVGYELLSNKLGSPDNLNKNLFFSVGGRVGVHFMKLELDDFSVDAFDAEAVKGDPKSVYQRSGANINPTEKHRAVTFIEVPIGIGFRMKSSLNSAWITQVRLVPRFGVFGKVNVSGRADYIAAIDKYNWSTKDKDKEDNSYNHGQKGGDPDPDFDIFKAGTGQKIVPSPEFKNKNSGFGLALQVSPTLYMDRTDDDPTNALAVGFDFTFNLGSLLYHKNEADNLLQYADAYDRPIAQQYLSGMTAFSVGARLGLVKKASTKP